MKSDDFIFRVSFRSKEFINRREIGTRLHLNVGITLTIENIHVTRRLKKCPEYGDSFLVIQYGSIDQIFSHYTGQGEQQRQQAYQTVKSDFEAKLQQAVQQQLGSLSGVNMDVEKLPQFQQEWRKVQTQMDSQYINLLNQYKKELASIS